jgi:hypothetical protein
MYSFSEFSAEHQKAECFIHSCALGKLLRVKADLELLIRVSVRMSEDSLQDLAPNLVLSPYLTCVVSQAIRNLVTYHVTHYGRKTNHRLEAGGQQTNSSMASPFDKLHPAESSIERIV